MNMKKHLITVTVLAFAVMLTTFSSCRKPKADDNTPAKEGLYLGIIGFNQELYTMPLGLLNQETKHNFENFVDGLTMQNGTILYHAVITGLNSLANAKIPENLINVSVVTFTDGLDQGSYVLSNNYNSGAEYLAAVNLRNFAFFHLFAAIGKIEVELNKVEPKFRCEDEILLNGLVLKEDRHS